MPTLKELFDRADAKLHNRHTPEQVQPCKQKFTPEENHAREAEEYEATHIIGKKRFGSPCSHETVKAGRCTNCLRKVV